MSALIIARPFRLAAAEVALFSLLKGGMNVTGYSKQIHHLGLVFFRQDAEIFVRPTVIGELDAAAVLFQKIDQLFVLAYRISNDSYGQCLISVVKQFYHSHLAFTVIVVLYVVEPE
jgi:hypothetical protein